jgi:hypothetical protein
MEKSVQESKVTYETAYLAKELGFDEICYYHFGSDGTEFESRHPTGSKNSQWVKCVARPTQAHLQAWLREIYNIDVEVSRDSEVHYKNEIRWISTVSNWNDIKIIKTPIAELKHPNHFHYRDNKSHKEALEVGLQEALKLLKQEIPNNI